MDPPPARRAASKRSDRRRRQRRAAAAAAATGTGSDVLVVERGGAAQENAAASSSSRRKDRRRRRRRNRAAKAAAETSKSPEAHASSDIVSIQGGSSQQSDSCLEALLADSSVSLTTTKKIVNSIETQMTNFQAGNNTTKVHSQDGAASVSLYRENGGIEASRKTFFEQLDVRSRCENCSASGYADTDMHYPNKDTECLVMRKTNLSENSEEAYPGCSSLQELEEHKENENGASNSSILKEEKKRKKRTGRKRRDRCKKSTLQDCALSNGADDSGLVVMVSEENTVCLPTIHSVSADDVKTKEEENVNLDSTSIDRNKLREQGIAVACSEYDNTSCLSPSNLAEAYAEKLKVVFSQRRTFTGFQKKKLLILDLNGILADINQDYHNAHMADAKVRGKLVFRRPYCDDFLKFCSSNFDLGIWSSRKKENVASVVNIVMRDFRPRILFCWDMSKCTFTGCKTLENMHKPLVLKELKKLWNKEDPDLPWEEGDYSPSNTLLVDDSPYKALLNPPNTAIFPRPYSYLNCNDNSLGPGGDLRVYLQNLATADDVESYVCNNPYGQPFITESDPHWNFYAQIAEKRNTVAEKGARPLTCCA